MRKGQLAIVAMALAFAVTTPNAQSYPDGMISYWKLDEVDGTTASDSVGMHDGTIHDGATWTSGQVGGGLEGNYSGYVLVPDSPSLNPDHITVEAWVYPRSHGGYRMFVAKKYSSGWTFPYTTYFLNLNGFTDYPEFNVTVGGIRYAAVSSVSISMNAWSHLVGTYDGETVEIHMNGVPVGANETPSGPIDQRPHPLHIGTAGNNYLDGTVDEVAVYDRVLSPEEIEQHYQNGLNGQGYEVPAVPVSSPLALFALAGALLVVLALLLTLTRRKATLT